MSSIPSTTWLEIGIYFFVLIGLSIPLGIWFGRYIESSETHSKWLRIGRRLFIDFSEMSWKKYLAAVLIFNFMGFLALLSIQLFQAHLPLNPQNLPNVPFWLAANTAISFVTNTNWQAYSGEASLSYFTQMIGLGVQNFLSAAVALAVLLAFARAVIRKETETIGNFWLDLSRSTLVLLLPLSILLAVLLVQQGVPQNLSAYVETLTLEGSKQILPMGPAASQIAIKQLGTNGGGFFGVNSAHPFENPTPFSNWLQMLSILLIPSLLLFSFGVLVRNLKHAAALWVSMFLLLIGGLVVSLYFQYQLNPITGLPFLEGTETRFGIGNSTLWSVFTTAASNGSVNAMHSSLSPLGGLIAMFNIMLGEVVFGGVGCGLYGMILFAILTVFLAGLMVGRTPEYLGKKIGAYEIIWASIGVLVPCGLILTGSSIAALSSQALSSLSHQGPHGLSEILYAFSSAAGNNGSAFAGLNANTDFYNISLGLCMLIGRFAVMVPVLAIGGSLAKKKTSPLSEGTFRTDSPIFVGLLISVILIVGALTFLPALTLGPIVEHLLMLSGRTF